jgi:hypothetical protein
VRRSIFAGSGFEPDDTTTIMLVSVERQVLLGSATTDDHGDLTYAVLLPVDLVNGVCEVRGGCASRGGRAAQHRA